MKNNDIEGISIEIQRINDKMLQAMKLHTDIAIRRSNVIKDLNRIDFGSKSQKSLAGNIEMLKICHNDEKMLMKIIEPAILRTKDILDDLTKDNKNKLGAYTKDILNPMLKALGFIEEKIPLTKARAEKEEKYLVSQNKKTFDEYHASWNKERLSDEELIKMLSPAQLKTLSQYRNIKEYGIIGALGFGTGAVSGLVVGPVARMGGVDTVQPLGAALFLGIIGSILAIILFYKDETQKILEVQRKAILDFKNR